MKLTSSFAGSISVAGLAPRITPFDEFNIEDLRNDFQEHGMSFSAVAALMHSEWRTETNPMLDLSSIVATYLEAEANELVPLHSQKKFSHHDMYPHAKGTDFHCMKWLSRPLERLNGSDASRSSRHRPQRDPYADRACSPASTTKASAKTDRRYGDNAN